MAAATPQHLIALTDVIKADWTERLRGEPALSPLGRLHTLGCLMDATLTQLFASLNVTLDEKWLRACAPVIASVHGHCACGIGPLLRYFAAGEEALKCATPREMAADVAHLLPRYRLLAQQEIDSLCKGCIRRGLAGSCALSEKSIPPAPGGR
jgi:hypothetical protein